MTILPSGATQFVASHPILSGVLGAIVALWATAYLYLRVLAERMSSYRNLPGPANPSLLLGNMAEIMANPPAVYQSRWHAQYGPTIRFRTLFGGHRLLTKDVRALAFLVNNSEAIQKPPQMTRILTNLIGEGVLTVETGHRRQRRVLNPAFGLPAMRNITPVFFEHGQALIEKLHGLIEDPSRPAGPVPPLPEDNVRGARKIDVCKYLAQTNLDVIGIAGFDYEFGSSQDRPNALSDAFLKMFSLLWWNRLGLMVNCHLESLPTNEKSLMINLRKQMVDVATDIVARKKRQVEAEYEGLEKGTEVGRDVLSLMIRANMAPDLLPNQRLSDQEVIDQITTLMFAATETTSSALSFGLWRLSQNQAAQSKLREEVSQFDGIPTHDELHDLPYLDKVVHEILRLDPPVAGTPRMASRDCVVPLENPVMGRDGKLMDSLKLRKGDQIYLPIITVNRSTDIWGSDAGEFNPERFDKESPALQRIPGVYGNLMTFIGGPRNCIGWRLAHTEIKSLLFLLVKNFIFEELPSRPSIYGKPGMVVRPMVAGQEVVGQQMPLLVRPVPRD